MLLLPAYSVVFDTSLLAPGTYSISATYEGPDYPPATYPASIPLTIVPPVSISVLTTPGPFGAHLPLCRP